jgi:hypothetical protein
MSCSSSYPPNAVGPITAVSSGSRSPLPWISGRWTPPGTSTGLLNHVDRNIWNFVFDAKEGLLFHVDLKPITFVARSGNEHNLNSIRDYFVV